MAINDIMEIGRQGLTSQRQALQTTSNNIANANTPGYSRQRAELQANAQSVQGGVRLGGGVQVADVIRVHDGFLQNQILEESRSFGAAKTRSDGMHQVESLLTADEGHVGDIINKFFNDARELSVNPEQPALRSNMMHSAQSAAEGFRKLSDSLTAVKRDLDSRLQSSVDEINSMTRTVSELNSQIGLAERTQGSPNDLYDRRDSLLRDLSSKLGMQTCTTDQGHINITADGIGLLVNGTHVSELVAMPTPGTDEKSPGSLSLFLKDGNNLKPVTHLVKDGEIGGLLHVRDEVINPTMSHLDHVAYTFAQNVNEIHQEGVGADGNPGRSLFQDLEKVEGAASRMDLSKEVKQLGLDAIAAGASGGAAGDNRIALRLSELQSKQVLPGNIEKGVDAPATTTLNESLNSLVGTIGNKTAHEDEAFHHQQAVVSQLDNYRQSVSGVSLEEEAVNMMQYQTVYNASAKAMKVGDELLQTILSIKE